jgi:DNA polymerase-3 subunit delta'
MKTSSLKDEVSLDVSKLDLKDIYMFLKENQKISKKETKIVIESILLKANAQKMNLTEKQLDLFSQSSKLLELNSRPINILTTLLLSLGNQKTKH